MNASKLSQFEGLMAPTFTPITGVDNQINYDVIEPYAKLLKSKGISAILVNGTSGEGMLLTVDERKKVTEKWAEVCKKFDILLMVQISGCSFPDAVELAKHAEALKVDGVLCLPELYFKPKTMEKLVQYIKDISIYCPKTPIYYYHIPMFTQVDLPMANFMELAKKEIPSFVGIKYTSGDLEKGIPCLKHGQVFLGSDTILSGAIALGFKNAIMTSLNINPEISLKIVELMENGKVVEAREQQQKLNDFVGEALKKGNGEWVPSMKKAFNDEFGSSLNLGLTRKPL
jgi:N-acetylneuraminate lyase